MQEEISKKIKRAIDHHLYTISDVMDCEFAFEGLLSKSEPNYKVFLKKEVLETIKCVLELGELPKLNPDFAKYEEEGVINDDKLLEYISKNVYYECNDFDRGSDHIVAIFRVPIIYLNFVEIKEEQYKLISHIKVKSFMGESEIGVSKIERI